MTLHPAGDPALAGTPAAQRPDEVLRNAMSAAMRDALRLGPGAGHLMPLPAVTACFHVAANAAHLAAYGLPPPAAGETYTVIHVSLPWGASFYNVLGRFHTAVNAQGPIMPGPGTMPSWNHAGWFQYGPVGAAQTREVLAPGGAPAAGAANITSYDTGHGSWTGVRACCAPRSTRLLVCSRCTARRRWMRTPWPLGWRCASWARCDELLNMQQAPTTQHETRETRAV